MSMPGEAVSREHVTKMFPLNSRRLTAETLTRIAAALGLPTGASASETRQLIEGKLSEAHEPRNVQVEFGPGVAEIRLRDEEGVIVEVPVEERTEEGLEPAIVEGLAEEGEDDADGGGARGETAVTSREEVLAAELESSRERARELAAELERLREAHEQREMRLAEEVRQLNDRVREEKGKYTTLWRMSCAQLTELDEAIASKDEEIEILRRRVHVLGEPAVVRPSTGAGVLR